MKNKHIFTFKNNEKVEYKVYFGTPIYRYKKGSKKKAQRVRGLCDEPKGKNIRIVIKAGMPQKEELEVSLEEFIHAFYFDKPEYKVRPLASTLAKFLYKQGWRKIRAVASPRRN